MARQYSSFLIRCWHLGEQEQRIKIEHVQSGDRTVVASLAAALAWLNIHWREQCEESASPGEQPVPAASEATSAGNSGQDADVS
jgi:hypothetical protein